MSAAQDPSVVSAALRHGTGPGDAVFRWADLSQDLVQLGYTQADAETLAERVIQAAEEMERGIPPSKETQEERIRAVLGGAP